MCVCVCVCVCARILIRDCTFICSPIRMCNNTQELKSFMALGFQIVNMRYKAQLPVKMTLKNLY